jgi:hypothetical protein
VLSDADDLLAGLDSDFSAFVSLGLDSEAVSDYAELSEALNADD